MRDTHADLRYAIELAVVASALGLALGTLLTWQHPAEGPFSKAWALATLLLSGGGLAYGFARLVLVPPDAAMVVRRSKEPLALWWHFLLLVVIAANLYAFGLILFG